MTRTIVASFRPSLHGSLVILMLALGIPACGGDNPSPGVRKPSDTVGATPSAGDSGGGAAIGADSTAQATTGVAPASARFDVARVISDSAATYQFRLRPRTGEVYFYRIVQKTSTVIDTLKGSDETVYNFHQTITGVNDDGSFTVEMVYDSIRLRLNTPATPLMPKARTFSYSTQQKSIDSSIPGAVQAKALIGRKVTITVTPSGEITDIANIEPIVSAMLGKYRDSLSPKAIEQLRYGVRLGGFQSVVQQLFMRTLPSGSVRVGHEWNRTDTLPLGGVPTRVVAKYRLAEVRQLGGEPVGKVVANLNFSFPRRSFDLPQAAIKLQEASASGSGEIVVSLATGFPRRKTTNIDFKVRMLLTSKATTGPSVGKSETFAQRTSQNSTVDLVGYRPTKL